MKCRVCREPAIIDIRRHNANFCVEHRARLLHRAKGQAQCIGSFGQAVDADGLDSFGERCGDPGPALATFYPKRVMVAVSYLFRRGLDRQFG